LVNDTTVTGATGINFSSDGLIMIVTDSSGNVNRYILSSAFTPSTLSTRQEFFISTSTGVRATFALNGNLMYLRSFNITTIVEQYALSVFNTEAYFEINKPITDSATTQVVLDPIDNTISENQSLKTIEVDTQTQSTTTALPDFIPATVDPRITPTLIIG